MKKFPISSNSMSYNISIFKTKLSMLMLASLSDVSKRTSICSVIYIPYLYMFIYIREALLKKKMFSFGHCPKRGGGRALPKFFDPFFHNVFPYILTSISCYLILFGHFKHQNHQKYQNYDHNYHSHHCRNHLYFIL